MPDQRVQAKIAVIGGDDRQISVVEALTAKFAEVVGFGLPGGGPLDLMDRETLAEAVAGADVIVFPITRIGADGKVSSPADRPRVVLDGDFWAALKPGALILAGSMAGEIKTRAVGCGCRVYEYAENDEIAVLNSIPTAEGALQLVMERLSITVHGSCCFVLGFGRVGLTTARLFKAVGAETWVFANRPALQARAREMGCPVRTFAELPAEIHHADVVINTVPAMVLPGEIAALTKPEVFLLDLASAPGGIDHQAAQALGRQSLLALGLPGRMSPVSAGRILASTLPAIIQKELR